MNTYSQDEIAIRSVISSWLQATQRGDIDAVLALMTEDALFLVPGQPPMTKLAFEAASRAQSTQQMRIEGTSEVKEVRLEGDMGYAWSHLDLKIHKPGAPEPIRRAGHTLTIFRRVAGRWLLSRDANLLVRV